MTVKELESAARHLAGYIEENGEGSDLSVIEAQLELMRQRLRMFRLAKQQKKTLELVKG